ncbi:hypothetical protein A2U01_0053741 [Trifolium medium]|uniref:Uncharacterized protein n=1 Tax=Trifolium medium TaxID=97028 RepID=A0A392R8I1_9FABA|nr:hypothetical protein [Trifolium medium]
MIPPEAPSPVVGRYEETEWGRGVSPPQVPDYPGTALGIRVRHWFLTIHFVHCCFGLGKVASVAAVVLMFYREF